MLVRLSNEQANALITAPSLDIGYFGQQGAVIGDAEKVVIDSTDGFFLATRDEFEFEGFVVRIKRDWLSRLVPPLMIDVDRYS